MKRFLLASATEMKPLDYFRNSAMTVVPPQLRAGENTDRIYLPSNRSGPRRQSLCGRGRRCDERA